MKTALIIPIFNQRKYWFKMFSAIESQSVRPDVVYVALDRQSQDDLDAITTICNSGKCNYIINNFTEIPSYVGKPQSIPDQGLFLVGHRRNQCIDLAINNGCECVIMIDGDCVPDIDLVKDHKYVNSLGFANISNGRRRESKYKWSDQREVDPKMRSIELFSQGNAFVIHNPDLLKSCSITWSCNLSVNLMAIKLIKKLNKLYYGRDEFFNSDFLGSWGGEDSFLGIQAVACKIIITMINTELSGIRHIDHPRPDSKYGDAAFGDHLMSHIEHLNKLQVLYPLLGEFYSF